jgi:concanavalin A-like lectin/glucanase superfamily protein
MSNLPDLDDRLDSWKEIAAFLRRTVRTVQRWEKTAGLPVRRGRPGQRRAVVASKAELSAWWTQQQDALEHDGLASRDEVAQSGVVIGGDTPVEPPPKGRRFALFVFALAAACALIVAVFYRPGRSAARPAAAVALGRVLAAVSSEATAPSFIDLGATPAGLAVSADGTRAYAALYDANAIAVVDLAHGTIVDTIPAVARPWPIQLSADDNRLFVGGATELGILDLGSHTIDRIRVGSVTEDLALSADGERLWVALGRGGLRILDTRTRQLETYPSVGCPLQLAMGRRSARVFVAYQCGGPGGREGHDALEVIDERTRQSLLARSGPPLVGSHLALSPDEQVLWADAHDACIVASYDHVGCPVVPSVTLHAIRSATLEPLASFALRTERRDSFPVFVPDGLRVVVGASGINVVNASLGHVEEHLPVGDVSEAIFVPGGRRLIASVADRRGLVVVPVAEPRDARGIDGIGTYWPGDGSAADVVGGAHAVQTEGLAFQPGRLGQAFAFTGRAHVSFGTRLDVDIANGVSSYTAWVKPAVLDRDHTVLSRAGGAGWTLRLLAGGRLAFCFSAATDALGCDRGGITAREALTHGWHHVAVVRGARRVQLFVDARLAADRTLTQPIQPSVADDVPAAIARLGSDVDGSTAFVGLIDEVALFRRALTAADLAELMNATTMNLKPSNAHVEPPTHRYDRS